MMKLGPSKIKLSWLLTLLIVVVVGLELYLAYTSLYPNLDAPEEIITTRNIVRVDLKAYEETINLLDRLESFIPEPLNLKNNNPFR